MRSAMADHVAEFTSTQARQRDNWRIRRLHSAPRSAGPMSQTKPQAGRRVEQPMNFAEQINGVRMTAQRSVALCADDWNPRTRGDRVGMEVTKMRRSGREDFAQLANCPTQARIGLEWATRELRGFRPVAKSATNGAPHRHPHIRKERECVGHPL
jgi:hypothetical protein